MIDVGIDEAGYGPLLGPLVVTGAAFDVPDAACPPDYWRLLSASISRRTPRRDSRLTIDDSKRLYTSAAGIAALERAALVVLHTVGTAPATLRGLLDAVADPPPDLDAHPWYRGFDAALPVAGDARSIALNAHAVACDMKGAQITPHRIICTVITEGEFNRRVAAARNKAVVLAEAALGIAAVLASARKHHRLRVTIDRHGGRKHYRDSLMTFFEPRHLRIIEETDRASAYELTDDQGVWSIAFRVQADREHMPVALASIYSKYLRELLMRGLNRFFVRHLPGLKPTAGYYRDARRFLCDVKPVIESQRLDRSMLVRLR